MPPFAQVVFNTPLRERFSYRVPASWESPPPIGSRVMASFGSRANQIGFVAGYAEECSVDPAKVRELDQLLDLEPLFCPKLLDLLEWVADYYFCSLGEVFFAAFPFGARTGVRLERVLKKGPDYELVLSQPKLSAKRRQVLECLAGDHQALSIAEIKAVTGSGLSVIEALVGLKALVFAPRVSAPRLSAAEHLYQTPPPNLNDDQRKVGAAVAEALRAGDCRQYLLHGVTGSGKTEVFLRSIEETLKLGKAALILVPEIALTPQTAARYRGRFPGQVEVLHSGLSQPRRFEAWQRVRHGEIPIVVGTRSAVFAPLANLGLIVVDEEHDPSYKQSDPAPRYHARDVACYRAVIEEAVVLLGSATPSLESYENVSRSKSTLLNLPRRATPHPLPRVELVDMRHRPPTERILSTEAREAIQDTLGRGLQTILFLNRRGHSTLLECRECGQALECPHCSVALVWHAQNRGLQCHHCGYHQPEPEMCPKCESRWIRARGYGTEQVLEAVENCFPKARAERIDLDVTQEQGAHDRILSSFRQGQIDILVGTQMVSKGLDMPGVRLVVVVQAETALNIADFRSAERSFALLTQVAGRAGRGDHPGLVLIQSYSPNHYSIFTALDQDYIRFRRIERQFRRQIGLPPHSRLLNIRAESEDAEKVESTIKALASMLEPLVQAGRAKGTRMIGPAPCPLEKLQARWRWQVLVATRDGKERAEILHCPAIQAALLKPSSGIKLIVDVDPVSLL